MPKKYNWEDIKIEYFNSDVESLVQFFSTRQEQIASNTYRKRTAGWQEEKIEFKAMQTENVKKKLIENPDTEMFQAQLLKAKDNIIKKVARLLGDGKDFQIGQMKNIKLAWEMLKTELGETTSIKENKVKLDEKPIIKAEIGGIREN